MNASQLQLSSKNSSGTARRGAWLIGGALAIATSLAISVAIYRAQEAGSAVTLDWSFHTPPMSDYAPVDRSFHTPPMSDYVPIDHSFHTPPMSDYGQ